jgi:hypothetical protein
LLDTLALQAQEGMRTTLSYRDYIAQFEADADLFYVLKALRPAPTAEAADPDQLAADIGRLERELEARRNQLDHAHPELSVSFSRVGAAAARLMRWAPSALRTFRSRE